MNFLQNLFKSETATRIIFIIEDNTAYARTLELYLKSKFPDSEIKIFPVAELCLMELNHNPHIIITDYFLDSKYPDAETGLEAVKEIRSKKPETNIILLSSQNEIALDAERKYSCNYIKKDTQAFRKVEEFIKSVW